MPSNSLLTSLHYLGLSPASNTPSTLTTRNRIDGKEKQRLLRKARRLSQVLGELRQARETVALAHPVGGDTQEIPPTGLSQLHTSSSRPSFTSTGSSSRSPRFSQLFHTVSASTMPPSLLPSDHDESDRTRPRRRSSIIPAHINQLDLTRFGLGRRECSGSTSSTHSDENAPHTDHHSFVDETLSESLHSLDVTRPRNKPRWRSVYNPRPMAFDARPRRSGESSMPAYSSKRSVSLWAKRRPSNEDQRHPLANQGQKDTTSGTHPPLTESQRIQCLRRGRKLTQVFGTVPPIALYSVPSQVEDAPATSDTVQSERTKAYLTLSSGDLRFPNSGRSSRHRSHSTLSQASAVSISLPSPNNDVEASREIENDQTPSHPLSDPDEDPDSTAQASHDRSEDVAFRRRRLRAAKLSRFFGVTYNDLTGPIDVATPGRDDADGVNPRVGVAEVDVRIDGPGWFSNPHSNHSGEGAHDVHMNDVIALLRQMPRA